MDVEGYKRVQNGPEGSRRIQEDPGGSKSAQEIPVGWDRSGQEGEGVPRRLKYSPKSFRRVQEGMRQSRGSSKGEGRFCKSPGGFWSVQCPRRSRRVKNGPEGLVGPERSRRIQECLGGSMRVHEGP